ncbi:hypothetical protein B0H13DRAFT_2672632 [Mycena leptocephala]|nr:hypothetical protein B0H13DRAFT_2672632 [Mycena leptocephala]
MALDIDLTSAIIRLRDTYVACVEISGNLVKLKHSPVNRAIVDRAIQCGRAYGLLCMVAQKSTFRPDPVALPSAMTYITYTNLDHDWADIHLVLDGYPPFHRGRSSSYSSVRWALRIYPQTLYHGRFSWSDDDLQGQLSKFLDKYPAEIIIPVLDRAVFRDWLFCIICFLGHSPDDHDLAVTDKSYYWADLLDIVFRRLALYPNNKHPDAPMNSLNLLKATASFWQKVSPHWHYGHIPPSANKPRIYKFCRAVSRARPDGWIEVVLSALPLAYIPSLALDGIIDAYPSSSPNNPSPDEVMWIYDALEHVLSPLETNPAALEDLFRIQTLHQALIDVPKFSRVVPSDRLLGSILKLLFSESHTKTSCAVDFLIDAPNWFQDARLQRVLKESSVWQRIGRFTEHYRFPFGTRYIGLAVALSQSPFWISTMKDDLHVLVSLYPVVLPSDAVDEYIQAFNSVLGRVWGATCDTADVLDETSGTQQTLGLLFTALASSWREFDFGTINKQCFASLAKGTTNIFTIDVPSPEFRALFYPRLSVALLDAAAHAREIVGDDAQHRQLLGIAADILTAMTQECGSLPDTDDDQDTRRDKIDRLIECWTSE